MTVGEWLHSIGLGQYEARLREHNIDWDVLPDLTEADLKRLGVALGPRKRLIKAIAALETSSSRIAMSVDAVTAHDAVERRFVTFLFCAFDTANLVAEFDAEDWRNVIVPSSRSSLGRTAQVRRACVRGPWRQPDGGVRLPACAGKRRRTRGARSPHHPKGDRRPQRPAEQASGAQAFGPNRSRCGEGRGRFDGRRFREVDQHRRARSGGGGAGFRARYRQRPASGRRAVRRRGPRRL